jgi:hypothetical protein
LKPAKEVDDRIPVEKEERQKKKKDKQTNKQTINQR